MTAAKVTDSLSHGYWTRFLGLGVGRDKLKTQVCGCALVTKLVVSKFVYLLTHRCIALAEDMQMLTYLKTDYSCLDYCYSLFILIFVAFKIRSNNYNTLIEYVKYKFR